MKANEQGAEGCWVEQSDCGIGPTPVERTAKEGRLNSKKLRLQCSFKKILSKSTGSLKTQTPVS